MAALVIVLAGCARHLVPPPPVSSGPSYVELEAGWRVRVITPMLKSGGFPLKIADRQEEGSMIAPRACDDFLGCVWALVANSFVFFTVATTRSSAVLIHLLGTVFAGILCSDRFGAYLKYHQGHAQFCWAHLNRDPLGLPAPPAPDGSAATRWRLRRTCFGCGIGFAAADWTGPS